MVTSYYDMYQKQLYNVEFNIESYQERIEQLKETLDDISLPFKKQFEYCKSINLKNAQEMPGNNINAIVNENNKLRNKISELNNIIVQLNNNIAQLKNKIIQYESDIKKLSNKNISLENQLKNVGSINSVYTYKNKINQKGQMLYNLMNEIEIKKKELAIFKAAIPFDLKEGEQLLTVIFVSGDQKVIIHLYVKILKNLIMLKIIDFMKYIPNIKKLKIAFLFMVIK